MRSRCLILSLCIAAVTATGARALGPRQYRYGGRGGSVRYADQYRSSYGRDDSYWDRRELPGGYGPTRRKPSSPPPAAVERPSAPAENYGSVLYTSEYLADRKQEVSRARAAEEAHQARPPAPAAAGAVSVRPAGPDPLVPLRRMCAFLGGTKQFSFAATTTMDTMSETGQMVKTTVNRRVMVDRPDKVKSDARGVSVSRKVYYNGKTLAVSDLKRKTYGIVDAPGSIDEMLGFIAKAYGITLPLADLLHSDLYEALLPHIRKARNLGRSRVGEHACDHLAFQGDTVDWEIWIDTGDRPLPRKVEIVYKLEAGGPQYEAVLRNWNLEPDFSPRIFEFTPPRGMKRIEILPLSGRGGPQPVDTTQDPQ